MSSNGAVLKEGYRSWKSAAAIDPNDFPTLYYLGWGKIVIGRTSEALPLAQRAIELDPLNSMVGIFPAFVHFYNGQFDKAVRVCKKLQSEEIYQNVPGYRFLTSYFLVHAGRVSEALTLLEPIAQTSASDIHSRHALILWHVLRGETRCLPELLTCEFFATEKRDPIMSCWSATFYAMLGDKEQSLEWLENAVKRGFINYPYFYEYDPFLTRSRGEVRFEKLMQRVKREWEEYEA